MINYTHAAVTPNTVFKGRQMIISDLARISSDEEMVKELGRTLAFFRKNQAEIVYLQNYYRGEHPSIRDREKIVREEIDNKVVLNYAWSAVRDIVGYYLGKPVQYVHRDSATPEETRNISTLNRILDAENKNHINTQIAQDQSICGTAYMGVFKDINKKNGSSLRLRRCEPASTFVVYSSDPDVDELFACMFYEQQQDPFSSDIAKTVYTIWTVDTRYTIIADNPASFDINNIESIESERYSYGGYLPIQEYPNNLYRIGDFEPALPILDAIDRAASNRDNDIEQTIQSILVAIGIDLAAEGVLEQLSQRGLLNVPAVALEAQDPKIEYIGSALDPNIGETFSSYLESCLNVVIGLPDRKSRSGGGADTGAAVELRDGWMDIDLVASFKEGFFIQSDRNALGAILYLLSANKEFSDLEVHDIEIKFSRNKTANIQAKSQAFATFVGAGIDPIDALEWCDLTTDINAVMIRMRAHQEERDKRTLEMEKKRKEIAMMGAEKTPDEKVEESSNESDEDEVSMSFDMERSDEKR